jgi:hypothetical protein
MSILKFDDATILDAGDKILIEATVLRRSDPSLRPEGPDNNFVGCEIGGEGLYAPRCEVRAIVRWAFSRDMRVFIESEGARGSVLWSDDANVLVRLDGVNEPKLLPRDQCAPRRSDEAPEKSLNAPLVSLDPPPARRESGYLLDFSSLTDVVEEREQRLRERAQEAIAAEMAGAESARLSAQ